jgi:hypothetical protein
MVILNLKKIQEKGMYRTIRLPLHSSVHLFPYQRVQYLLRQTGREMYSDERAYKNGEVKKNAKQEKTEISLYPAQYTVI